MSEELDMILIASQATPATAADAHTKSADTRPSGLTLETMRTSWIYCKASKKMVARSNVVPRLGGAAAVLSTVTGLSIFATLQASAEPWARITVAVVALLTAVVATLQTWGNSRIKALNSQSAVLHEFHREVVADIESGKAATDPNYTGRKEDDLQKILAGIIEPSNRAWHDAEKAVDKESRMLFPHLFPAAPPER